MPLTVTDFVLTGAGKVGVYVQLRDNISAAVFTSASPTDSNGQFSIANLPPADYSAYTSPNIVTPVWTLYDPHYRVGYTKSDMIVATVQVLLEIGPYSGTLIGGIDASAGEVATVTLTADRIVGLFTNPTVGQTLELIVTMGGAGSYKLTWPAAIKTAWQPTPAVGSISSLKLRYVGTNWQQVGGPPVSDAGDVLVTGRLLSNAPGVPVASLLGANVTSVTPAGNDMRGQFTIVIAGAVAAGTRVARITYATPFPTPPALILLVDQNSAALLVTFAPYSGAEAAASFDLFTRAAGGLTAGTYIVRYLVIL